MCENIRMLCVNVLVGPTFVRGLRIICLCCGRAYLCKNI